MTLVMVPLLLATAGCPSSSNDSAGLTVNGTAGTSGFAGQGGIALPSAGAGAAPGVGTGTAGNGAGTAGASEPVAGNGAVGGGAAGSAGGGAPNDGMRDVLLVGNSVSGTVSFVDAVTFENLGSVNVIPDLNEIMTAINLDLVRAVAYPIVKNAQLLHHFEPSNGDRFVDDVFVSLDGTILYVSRSNLGDVAAFDLTKADHPRLWHTNVDSPKADHAALSPDGKVLVVSATGTGRVADVIDAKSGAIVGDFPTGYYPHQNDFSPDGKYIYNSSIGNVGYNAVSYANNAMKGDRWLVKIDANTLQEVKKWVFEYGIRPNVFSADQTTLYTQLSYLNGVIKYDLANSKEIARSEQPLSKFAMDTYATYDEYPHDSAHHGLALSGDGSKLCDCGTIDNDVAIVTTADMKVQKRIDVGMVPYWATTSPDGRYCFVSLSGDNTVSIIDYETAELVKTVKVGNFPQRSRLGRVPQGVIDGLTAPAP
jgi:YVTN family beta-propeller protein